MDDRGLWSFRLLLSSIGVVTLPGDELIGEMRGGGGRAGGPVRCLACVG